MAEPNSIDPNALARQFREKAILQAEENYKTALNVAAKAREYAIQDATTTKVEAVKQTQAALDLPKKRLNEARDRIEAKLRKRELDEARHNQEQVLIKAEDTRVKAIKQAEELGKHMIVEADETHRRAIQQAYEAEKKMKREAEQAIKTQKEAVRNKTEDERKGRQTAEQEAAEAKIRDQKATTAERSAREALAKNQQTTEKEETEPINITKTPAQPESAVKPVTREVPKVPVGPPKADQQGTSINRTGMIKLIIVHEDADSDHMVDFENSLHKIPDIRIVMVGGTAREGAQIIVSSEKPVVLSDILRRLPMVEEVTDRPADIFIKLKQVVIFENNA